ncbi:MAG: glycine oxidase ThiO [Solirubrobacteraceae bacterium]
MPETTQAADVVVIGGGAIGLSVAWRAAQHGMRVVVLDGGRVGGGTSYHAAGMLAPIAEAVAAEQPLLELGLRSAGMYPAFVDELLGAAGVDGIGFTCCGTLMVARDADEAEALERELALRLRFGLAVQRLRPSQARALEPALATALRLALHVPDDHAVDPRALTAALAAAVRAAGGELREHCPAASIECSGGRVSGVRLGEDGLQRLSAPAVVIAAGAWSPRIAGVPDGAGVPVSPVKGQILRLHDPAGPGLLTRVVRMGPSYLVPRGDGRYVLGATQEERGFDRTVTAGAAFELLRDAAELVPGVSELVIDELSAGLRPGTPDNLPAIGPSPVDGLHWATGHRRGGILLAPATAELVVAGLAGEALPEHAQPFSPTRFQRARVGSPA